MAAVIESPDHSASTLEELMSRYVGGDAAAFDELYRRVSPKLFGYLLRLTRNRATAEDVLQTTFAKVHRARAAYIEGAPFVPWILVIARRTFFDERRGASARLEVLTDEGIMPEGRSVDRTPELEAAQQVDQALAQLPAHYREAIELTKLGGLSGAEAARALDTTRSAIKLRVHRGYAQLRRFLESDGRGAVAAPALVPA